MFKTSARRREQQRNYYLGHRAERAAYDKARRSTTEGRAELVTKARAWRDLNREKYRAYQKHYHFKRRVVSILATLQAHLRANDIVAALAIVERVIARLKGADA